MNAPKIMRKSTKRYLKKRIKKQYKIKQPFVLRLIKIILKKLKKNYYNNFIFNFYQITKKDKFSLFLFFATRFAFFLLFSSFLMIIGFIFTKGFNYITPSLFEWNYNSNNISMMPSIINTLSLIFFSLLFAIPISILGAVFLNEYQHKNNKIITIIELAIETLAGIPSIVYGLFGYLAFVIYFKLGLSFISGILTLSIMVLPLLFKNAQEAIQAVPQNLREAAFGLGAGKLRTIFAVVLPCASHGILSGIILSIGKIVGESAALLYTAGNIAQVASLMNSGRTLSVHMYEIAREGLHINEAYATAMVLIILVFFINLLAHWFNQKISQKI